MARKRSASAKSGSGEAKASGARKAGRSAGSKKPSRPGGAAPEKPVNPETHESTPAALRESEQNYLALVEQSLQGLVVVQDARVVVVNRAFAEICGYTVEELVSLPSGQVTALVHPDDQALVWRRSGDRPGGEPAASRYDCRLIRRDGCVRWVEVSARRIQYRGKPAVQLAAVDVTDRRHAEKRVEETERLLQKMFDSIQDGITVRDRDFRLIQTNRWVERKFASEMPLVGRRCYEAFQKRESPCPWCPAIPAMETGEPHSQVVPYPSDEDRTGWLELTAFPMEDADGNVVGAVEHVRDVTERCLAEQTLREAEERARVVFENARDGIIVGDPETRRVVDANRAMCEMLGYQRDELLALRAEGLDPAEVLPRVMETLERQKHSEALLATDVPMRSKDGSVLCVDINASAITLGGRPHVMGVFRDVTERKRADDVLDFERRQLLSIFDGIDEIIYVIDPETYEVLYANRALRNAFGDVAGRTCYRVFQGLESPCPFCTNDQILGENVGKACIWEHRNRVTGRWYRCIDRAIRWPDGRIVRHEMAIDVTDRKRAEEALRESEQKFRGIAERSFDTLFMMDLQGKLTYVSPAVEGAFRYKPEEMLGRPFTDFMPDTEMPRALRRVSQLAAGTELDVVPGEGLRKDGSRISLEISSSLVYDGEQLVGIQGIIRDVTERNAAEEKLRRMEAQLAHVGRLSTMGELVGGIAHEVSQPLYSVLNYAKASRNVLAGESEPNWDDLRGWSEQIAAAASRAGQIIARLRSFVRRSELERSPTPINEVVEESVELVAFETRRHEVAVQLDLGKMLAPVHVDRVQIQQVLVNLLRNACEALDQIPPGTRRVIIRTSQAGESVRVSVSDNGPGLPAKEDLNPFDAFVTSKPAGLGIGLAISRTIIEAHGGDLRADPSPEGGATFHFSLPVAKGADDGTRTDRVRRR